MIDVGVPLSLLEDLLEEPPSLFPEDQTVIQELIGVLEAWLDFLNLEGSERATYLSKLDPDLANTLQSLGKELPPQARHRYDLEEPSEPESAD